MIAILIICLVLFLIAVMKVGVRLTYLNQEFDYKVRLGFFRVSVSDQKKKESMPKDQTKDIPEKEKKSKEERSALIKSWMKTIWHHKEEVMEVVRKVFRAPVLDKLIVHMVVGASDPDVCAMKYGKYNAAAGTLLPIVENVFGIRKREILIGCDFFQDQDHIEASAEITIRVYQLVSIAIAGLKLLIKLSKTQKIKYKAVQLHESSSS